MVNEINKFKRFSKKKKTDKSFSKKINFYRSVAELPEVIEAEDYKKFISKRKSRLGKKKEGWHNGSRYDSKWEARYAAELDLKIRLGEVREWKKQVTIEMNAKVIDGLPVLTDEKGIDLKKQGVKYYHICNYRIDFVVEHSDGQIEYVEVKGYRTEIFILKHKIFAALFSTVHPGYKLTIVN